MITKLVHCNVHSSVSLRRRQWNPRKSFLKNQGHFSPKLRTYKLIKEEIGLETYLTVGNNTKNRSTLTNYLITLL